MAYTSKQTARETQSAEEATAKQTAPTFTDQRTSTGVQLQQQQLMNTAQAKFVTAQRAGVEEEEPLQGKFETAQRAEEEELLQGKFETAQRAGVEEEPLQGKFETAQRAEEEELLQGKFETAQLIEEEEPIQGKFETLQRAGAEEKKANNTGMPDNLKSGIENLSGYSMDDVKVHYNSDKPAQLNAHAYAQGTDIHVAPGQEQHLPHEAWHVVQQKQGRVQPTMQMKTGVPVNDDAGLENEADVMGAKAAQMVVERKNADESQNIIQGKVVQRFVPFEKASIHKRVVVTDALASDYKDPGLITRPSRNVPRTHVVEFDNAHGIEYRAKPEELEFEEKQMSKRIFAHDSEQISRGLTATKTSDTGGPKNGPVFTKPTLKAEHLRKITSGEATSEEHSDWSNVMKGKLWAPGGREANIAGSSLATAHTEASALSLVKASGYPITVWNPEGSEEQQIILSSGVKGSKAPDYRVGDRVSDAFRVTLGGTTPEVLKAIEGNVTRKRGKYKTGVVYVAVLTAEIADLTELLKAAPSILAERDILLIVIGENVHHVGAPL